MSRPRRPALDPDDLSAQPEFKQSDANRVNQAGFMSPRFSRANAAVPRIHIDDESLLEVASIAVYRGYPDAFRHFLGFYPANNRNATEGHWRAFVSSLTDMRRLIWLNMGFIWPRVLFS